jgi:opacity protein-like surface antigen
MKKLLLAVIAAFSFTAVATPALADDRVRFGVRYDDSNVENQDRIATSVDYDHSFDNGFKLGVGVRHIERLNDNRSTNRYMIRGGYDWNIFFVNGQLGMKMPSGQEHSYFWTVQSGVKFKVTDKLNAKLSYDYREGFRGNGNSAKDNDYRYGPRASLTYKLDKKHAVQLQVERLHFANDTRNRVGILVERRF